MSEEAAAAPAQEAQKTEGPRSTAPAQPDIKALQEQAQQVESSEAVAGTGSEVEEETQEQAQEPAPGQPRKPKKPGMQVRIDELTAEKYAKQAEIEARDRRIAELEAMAKAPRQAAESGAEKTIEDFDYDDVRYKQYLKDQGRREYEENQRREQAEAKRQEIERNFVTRQVAFSVDHPDYQDVAYKSPVAPYYPPDMVDFIFESDLGPQLAYHLGKNLSEADAIIRMTPRERDRALLRIEAKLEAKPAAQPRTLTQAPAPVRSLSGNGNLDKSLDDMSMEEFAAKRKQQIAAKRF